MVFGWIWYGAVAVLVVGLSLSDWTDRRIPNAQVVTLLAAALLLIALGEADPGHPGRLVVIGAAGAAFALAVGLYGLGLIAAGDAKLVLPVALIMAGLGGGAWMAYLATLIVVGLVVAIRTRGGADGIPLAPVVGLGLLPALLFAGPATLF